MRTSLKGTCLTLGLLGALWGGHWMFIAPEHAERMGVSGQPQSQRSEALQQTLEQLNTRLAALEKGQRGMSTLHRRLDQLEGTPRGLPQTLVESGSSQAETLPPEDDAENPLREAQETAREQEVIAHYEAVFWNEQRDATWSTETEAHIMQAWDSEVLKGSQLLMATCQSSLCRLEVGHDDEGARGLFLMNLASIIPFETEGFAYPLMDGDEQIGAIFYVSRPGYSLP
jgi:hypothetical protein